MLEAINFLLEEIGATPVADEESTQPDVAGARRRLLTAKKAVQRRGYWFNRDEDITFSPNQESEITLPNNTLSYVSHNNAHHVLRGNRLYNSLDSTYKFTEGTTGLLISDLEWEEIPFSAQEVIKWMACNTYTRRELEDPARTQEILMELNQARMDLRHEEVQTTQLSLNGSPRAVRARSRVRPYSMGRSRNPIHPGG